MEFALPLLGHSRRFRMSAVCPIRGGNPGNTGCPGLRVEGIGFRRKRNFVLDLCGILHPNSDINCRSWANRTRLPVISALDDICWIGSKRASSTGIVASLYRLAVVPFHLVQQWDRNVA